MYPLAFHSLYYFSKCTPLRSIHFITFLSVPPCVPFTLSPRCVQVPAVAVTGNVTWFPNEFLTQKLPNMAKALDRRAMVAVVTSRQTWLQQRNQALTRWVQNVLLTLLDSHFQNLNMLDGGPFFLWNQYPTIVRKKLSTLQH